VFYIFFHSNNIKAQHHSNCNFFATDAVTIYPQLSYSETAQNFVNLSLNKLGLKNIYIRVLIQDHINNCYATLAYGYPLLVLDVNWLNKFNSKDDWFHVYVIGHEIGHIVLNHFNKQPINNFESQEIEIEADVIGGILLNKYYFPYNSLRDIYPTKLYTTIDNSHPTTERRIIAVDNTLGYGPKSIFDIFKNRTFDIKKAQISDDLKFQSFQNSLNEFSKTPNHFNYTKCINEITYVFNSENIDYYVSIVVYVIRTAFSMNIIDKSEFNEKIEYLYKVTHKRTLLLSKVDFCYNGSWTDDNFNLAFDSRLQNIEAELITDLDKINYLKLLIFRLVNNHIQSNYVLEWYEQNIIPMSNERDFELTTEFLSVSFVLYHYLGDYLKAQKLAEQNVKYWQSYQLDLYVKNSLSIAYGNLGLIYFRLQEYRTALLHYQKSLSLYYETNQNYTPEKEQIYIQIARCYYHFDDLDKAKTYIDYVNNQQDGFFYYLKGMIYYKLNFKAIALRHYEKSCTLKYQKSCQIIKTFY
ncbi:MAG: tetratricopeptide repeat protein, partial [Bacteroidetes bacterium]|nr:tetratricopeptide repeat protein [Bacteroidota bacterium]